MILTTNDTRIPSMLFHLPPPVVGFEVTTAKTVYHRVQQESIKLCEAVDFHGPRYGFDVQREHGACFAVEVAFEWDVGLDGEVFRLDVEDGREAEDVMAGQQVAADAHELRHARPLDGEQVELAVVDFGDGRDVFEARDGRAVDDEEEVGFGVVRHAVRHDVELHGAHFRQLADAAQVVGELAERVLQARRDFVRDARQHARARDVDDVLVPDFAEVDAARAARGDGVEIGVVVVVDMQVRREIVRRAAADNANRKPQVVFDDEVHDFMHGAVAASRDDARGLDVTHEFREVVVVPQRAVRDDDAAALLEFLDDPVELLLEGRMARDGIVSEHEPLHFVSPFPAAEADAGFLKTPMARRTRML